MCFGLSTVSAVSIRVKCPTFYFVGWDAFQRTTKWLNHTGKMLFNKEGSMIISIETIYALAADDVIDSDHDNTATVCGNIVQCMIQMLWPRLDRLINSLDITFEFVPRVA